MSTLDTIRGRVRQVWRQVMGRPLGYLSAEWERMPTREKRSVTILGIAIVVVAASLVIYLVFSSISDLEQSNGEIREALAAINKNRDSFLEAKARAAAQEARLGSDPPQLVADIEAAAREEALQIAESNERPPVSASKRWIEHDVDLKVREVDLKTLTSFLKRVETGKRPIFFTHLSLKRRFSEADKLDAELTAVAFERVKDKAGAKKKGDDGGTNAGGASGRTRASGKESR